MATCAGILRFGLGWVLLSGGWALAKGAGAEGAGPVEVTVHFDRLGQAWDGFGVNYVETRHTRDYGEFAQDYGGMKYLDEAERREVITLVFGPDGLQPDLIKVFADPFMEPVNDNGDPRRIDPAGFDHERTTGQMRFFLREGLAETRRQGRDLVVLAGLYGPPGWMSRQKTFRGRDLDPAMQEEVVEFMVAWVQYLQEKMGAGVRYISMHNEGESYNRWREDGRDHPSHYGHDFNMFWRDGEVADFIRMARRELDRTGLTGVGVGTGEPSTWTRLFEYNPGNGQVLHYAQTIRDDAEALAGLGLITSHGFDYLNGRPYDPRAVELLRAARPDLPAWTTSCTWGDMSLDIVRQAAGYLYVTRVNGIIPWATVHHNYESDKLHPPRGFRISGNANSPILTNHGIVETTKAYYYYKQLCRAGRGGMRVAEVATPEGGAVQALAWSGQGTSYPDAFILTNAEDIEVAVEVKVEGSAARAFAAHGTQDSGPMNYSALGRVALTEGWLRFRLPARSAVTFLAEP